VFVYHSLTVKRSPFRPSISIFFVTMISYSKKGGKMT